MQVEWLKTALKNLDEEAAFLSQESPQAATDFISAVRACVEQLSLFPAMGRMGRVAGTREWPVTNLPYLIPYRVRDSRLQILRIFHTRRLPPSQW